ncbi:adenylate cyclase, partial [Shouchella miscanthi]|nr:adenylate cyclase [Shouchella miscanthi]
TKFLTVPKVDLYDLYKRAICINTYMNMLNKLLTQRNLPNINAGIGLSASETLVVKAGRKSINNLVWIGKSVPLASKLADISNKNKIKRIAVSETFHYNIIDIVRQNHPHLESAFIEEFDEKIGNFYHLDLYESDFVDWIDEGMPT